MSSDDDPADPFVVTYQQLVDAVSGPKWNRGQNLPIPMIVRREAAEEIQQYLDLQKIEYKFFPRLSHPDCAFLVSLPFDDLWLLSNLVVDFQLPDPPLKPSSEK